MLLLINGFRWKDEGLVCLRKALHVRSIVMLYSDFKALSLHILLKHVWNCWKTVTPHITYIYSLPSDQCGLTIDSGRCFCCFHTIVSLHPPLLGISSLFSWPLSKSQALILPLAFNPCWLLGSKFRSPKAIRRESCCLWKGIQQAWSPVSKWVIRWYDVWLQPAWLTRCFCVHRYII